MIRNHWIETSSNPPLNEEVLAKVKGFGICKMMRISSEESNLKCSYRPSLWKAQHEFTWREINDRFVFHENLIQAWKYINLPMSKIR